MIQLTIQKEAILRKVEKKDEWNSCDTADEEVNTQFA